MCDERASQSSSHCVCDGLKLLHKAELFYSRGALEKITGHKVEVLLHVPPVDQAMS